MTADGKAIILITQGKDILTIIESEHPVTAFNPREWR